MMQCRVCGSDALIKMADYKAPSVTSICTQLDVDTIVHMCPTCSHVQSSDLPASVEFYDQIYRISLISDDHDQMLTGLDGTPMYRTMLQADVAAKHLPLAKGAAVLDFGSGKATTLQRLASGRPDLDCYVFDVSQDYVFAWEKWLRPEKMASYEIPKSWQGSMDAVTLNFVLEHVSDVQSSLQKIVSMLKPGGYVFAIVPDFLSNPVDILVVDHVNHFTVDSLNIAFARVGMIPHYLSVNSEIRNSIVAIYQLEDSEKTCGFGRVTDVETELRVITQFWSIARTKLRHQVSSLADTCKFAIFGAGVYGSLIHSALDPKTSVECFLDNNPTLVGTIKNQLPVFLPGDLPDGVTHIIMGVNPAIAEKVFAFSDLASRPDTTVVYLDH